MKDSSCLTALHWAALNDDNRVVQYLLSHGANMQYSNYQQTPLDVAGTSTNLQVKIVFKVIFLKIVDIILNHWWALFYDKDDDKPSLFKSSIKKTFYSKLASVNAVADLEVS